MADNEQDYSDSDSFPFGEGVSDRGGDFNEGDDDDEDLYYIPERRPSLDLGQDGSSPGDDARWW